MQAVIVGAGAQGRVILDILRAMGRHTSIVFADDSERLWGTHINGAPVLGGVADTASAPGVEVIVALGNPLARLEVAAKLRERDVAFLNAVHPSAVIMPSVRLGCGAMVGATAVVNTDTRLGDHVIVNTGAVVEHDSSIADGVVIGPGAHLGGRVAVKRCAFIATGVIVLSRLTIGAEAVVGAGAVVTRDVPDRVLAMGVPARVREPVDADFDWKRLL